MIEIFKDIPNFEMYSVSIYGNIRNNKTGQILKPRIRKDGYLQVSVKPNGQKSNKTFRIHREVAEAFIANPDNLPQVNHKDGNKHNNNVNNLEWCTQEYNNKHANMSNLVPALKGSLNGRSKLDENTVHEICLLFQDTTMITQEVADKFNISLSKIQKIRCGIAWKHIWCQYSIKVNKRTTNPND